MDYVTTMCSALVAAHLCSHTDTSRLLELATDLEIPTIMGDHWRSYAVLADRADPRREQRLAQLAGAATTGQVPGAASDYLAVFGRLAYERGDHTTASALLSGIRTRQVATFALANWTRLDLAGIPYNESNDIASHRAALATVIRGDNPQFHGSQIDKPPPTPTPSELQLLTTHIRQWTPSPEHN